MFSAFLQLADAVHPLRIECPADKQPWLRAFNFDVRTELIPVMTKVCRAEITSMQAGLKSEVLRNAQ
jgi:hypothetical protein